MTNSIQGMNFKNGGTFLNEGKTLSIEKIKGAIRSHTQHSIYKLKENTGTHGIN